MRRHQLVQGPCKVLSGAGKGVYSSAGQPVLSIPVCFPSLLRSPSLTHIQRHRMVMETLDSELKTGVHALSIQVS